jgi:NAD(P)-dependent dehydrogenase (short-subunit alcohol dehydrogenase family)
MSQPIAVITGSSSGIGAACVHEFAAAGFWTIGIDVEPGSDADEHLVIDLASPDSGREVADAVGDRGVSVLINNAAVPGARAFVILSIALIGGICGLWIAWRRGGALRYFATLYGTIVIFALWESFDERSDDNPGSR